MSKELDLELRARELVDETIAEVQYQQLRWSDSTDIVELAVHLHMESGLRFRIGWDDEFSLKHGYGITVSRIRRIDRDAGPIVDADWPKRTIRAATLRWASIHEAMRGTMSLTHHFSRADYPHALELVLDDDSKIVVECEFTNHLRVRR